MNTPNVDIERRDVPLQLGVVHEHPLVSTLLLARGVTEPLDFSLGQLPSPAAMGDMALAVERLTSALSSQQRILIVGDYDCDGATSTTLAMLALRAMGAKAVSYFVPNRFVHGYGLSPDIVEIAAAQKADLIVTVDNGIASVAGVERATELGIDVVVTDHHLPPAFLPKAAALVNPNLPEADFPSRNIAGVGVIFFVMIALRTHLKARGWFEAQSLGVPNLADLLDLVAIGTVADVVPLDNVNRILVEQGIRRIRAGRSRPGVNALLEVASVNPLNLVAQDIGFVLGPRLNAAGRLDDMSVGIECLLGDSTEQAGRLASELNTLNVQRRQLEREMRQQSEDQVWHLINEETVGPPDSRLTLCLYHTDWNQGVIGILAGRLKEKLHRPVIIFSPDLQSGRLKGSGRSISGLHLLDVLKQVQIDDPSLFTKFGGHAMAAGLEIAEADFQRFSDAFEAAVSAVLRDGLPSRRYLSDGPLSAQYFNTDTATLLKRAAPWGQAFEAPLFDNLFRVTSLRILKDEHLRLGLMPLDVGDSSASVQQGIYFRCLSAGEQPDFGVGEQIRVVYSLDVNRFRGDTSTQLMIQHIEGFATQSC